MHCGVPATHSSPGPRSWLLLETTDGAKQTFPSLSTSSVSSVFLLAEGGLIFTIMPLNVPPYTTSCRSQVQVKDSSLETPGWRFPAPSTCASDPSKLQDRLLIMWARTGLPRHLPKSAPTTLYSSWMGGYSAFPSPLPKPGVGTGLRHYTLLKGWLKESYTFSLGIILTWSLKSSCELPVPLWGWHRLQFYSHRRAAKSEANSIRRLELLQYLSPIKMTRI